MNITIIPKSRLGKWSLGLLGGFVLFIALFAILAAYLRDGGETFFSNLRLSLPILLAGLCGIAAFFTGSAGIVFSRERSVLVFLAVLIGLFVLVFFLGEVLFPH